MQSLINALYGELLNHNEDHPLGPDYFLDWTILAAKNSDVNSINANILTSFHGNKLTYQCQILRKHIDQAGAQRNDNVVFIPRMAMDSNTAEFPVPL